MYSMQGVPDLKQSLKIIFLFKIDFFIEGATDELIYIVASFLESCVFLDSCSRNWYETHVNHTWIDKIR